MSCSSCAEKPADNALAVEPGKEVIVKAWSYSPENLVEAVKFTEAQAAKEQQGQTPSISDVNLVETSQDPNEILMDSLDKPEEDAGNKKTEAYWKGYADGGEAERDIQKKMMKHYAAVFFVSFAIAIAGLLLAIKFKVV